MNLNIEVEREDDGRWIAEVPDLPGVMAYGKTRDDAVHRVQALALRVIADRVENGETSPIVDQINPDLVFTCHDADEIGPRMLARIGKRTGRTPGDL